MSPLKRYQRDIKKRDHVYDPAQERIVHYAQSLWQAWPDRKPDKKGLRGWFSKTKLPVKGLYIWGGVGRGKTYILDLLYCSLPTERKVRVHFHQFMLDIHASLRRLSNVENPLQLVAKQSKEKVDIIFLDEFHVSDIADAMLLAGLLESFFASGITLVTTSNIHTNNLYRDGLQRKRFLPAIELINKHTDVLELSDGVDYRKGVEVITGDRQEEILKIKLAQLTILPDDYNKVLVVNNRKIVARMSMHQVAWFDFNELCNTPRSAADYLVLAKMYNEIIVSDIPVFSESNEDAALRFIHLIDALYDLHVKLIYTLSGSLADLYQGRLLTDPFKRTVSRLTEMVSDHYANEVNIM